MGKETLEIQNDLENIWRNSTKEGARLTKEEETLWDVKCIAECAGVSPVMFLHKY